MFIVAGRINGVQGFISQGKDVFSVIDRRT